MSQSAIRPTLTLVPSPARRRELRTQTCREAFEEFVLKRPDDLPVLEAWLRRVVRPGTTDGQVAAMKGGG
jgi:hypothetical protein